MIGEGLCVAIGRFARTRQPSGREQGPPNLGRTFSAFEDVVTKDLVPYIDSTLRTIPDRDHRALAGLSMGGLQAYTIGLKHTDIFSNMGGSAEAGADLVECLLTRGTAYNGVMADSSAFNKRMHVLFLSIGTAEAQRMQDGVRGFHDALDKAGVKSVLFESTGTDHEWLTWRRSLHEFAPLLFQSPAVGQAAVGGPPQRGPGGFGGPIVLNADDVQAYPEPPDDINANRPGVPHGKLEMIEYEFQIRWDEAQDAGVHANLATARTRNTRSSICFTASAAMKQSGIGSRNPAYCSIICSQTVRQFP